MQTTALLSHIDYWDRWHSTWHHEMINTIAPPNEILKWPVPKVKGGNNILTTELEACEFFPEPYWGNIFQSASSIFINYNPGGGGHLQHKKTWFEFLQQATQEECHILWSTYANNNCSYAKSIQTLAGIADYPTTKWLHDNRAGWANELAKAVESNFESRCEKINTIMFEYCPWHTVKASSIMSYLLGKESYGSVPGLIEKHILEFAVEKASNDSCGPLRKMIFSKGTILPQILKNSINHEIPTFEDVEVTPAGIRIGKKSNGKGGWLINIFKIKDVFLINCHGPNGGGNGFPKVESPFLDIIKYIISIRK